MASHPSQNSSGKQTTSHKQETEPLPDKSGLWGFLAGLIVAVFIAAPLSGAVALATHPATQQLFDGRLQSASQGGYAAFWWVVAIMLLAAPFLVGFGVAKLSARTLGIIGGIVVIFLIAILVLGQLFLFH